MSYNNVERKDRAPSPSSSSHRNVVDHESPNARKVAHDLGATIEEERNA
ncbi:hypothetical protein MPER_00970, partial [Moniliophthora perniciosa FA553]